MLALPARAQVPGLPIDESGPYPDLLGALEPVPPAGSGGDAGARRFGSDPPRRPAAAAAGREGILRYRFVGEHNGSRTGWDISFSDVDCDGFGELLVAAPTYAKPRSLPDQEPGAAYLVSMADVTAADAADGNADGVIDLGLVAAQPRSWKLTSEGLHYVGTSVDSGGDVDGDGCADLLIGARAHGNFTGSAYVISAFDLPAADAADGEADGVVNIGRIADQPDSWEITGEADGDNAGWTVIFPGDVNRDGLSDLLIGAAFYGDDNRGAVYLLSGAALASADAADGDADGRITLASVAAQPNSWKLVGEQANGRAGYRMTVANLDSDDRPDLVVIVPNAHTPGAAWGGAVYLIAAADLPAIDRADGQSDGMIGLDAVAGGEASWKLVGDFEEQRIGSGGVAAGDLDGDGVDNLILSNSHSEVFVISASDLPSADVADGTVDRVVALDSTLEQDGSFKLVWKEFDGDLRVASSFDVHGDGLDDLLIGNESILVDDRCAPDGGFQLNGVVALLPGGGLQTADAGDGAADSVIDLHRLPLEGGFSKFIGAPTDRLGTAVRAGDIDGDGRDDPLLASYTPLTPYRDCGSRIGQGYVFAISSAHMAAADAVDGETDGEIRLGALDVPWQAANDPIVLRPYDDRVTVVGAPEFLDYRYSLDALVKSFLQHYGDVVDYLLIVTDLPSDDPRYYYSGRYVDLRNSVAGIGKRVFDPRVYGERLKGFIHLTYFNSSDFPRTLAHEIMHAWANFIIDAGLPHWGFSSANGVLGGFDPTQLVNLGAGRYTAGSFRPLGADRRPYSPMELYLAGLIPPEEVPDLWVANDGEWTGEYDASGNRIFTASDIETWSIDRVVDEKGVRTPSWLDSQKNFRVATILIVDDPARSWGTARELSEALRAFSMPGPDGSGSYNFWEATGGLATLTTDVIPPNRPPETIGTLPPLTLGVYDPAVSIEVREAFGDPDGDALNYRAASSAPAVAAVAVLGSALTVTPVSEGTATVKVTATDLGGLSAEQAFAVTVEATVRFADDPIVPGVTPIKSVHFTELRTWIDTLRSAAGLPRFSWTDPVLRAGVTRVRLVHLRELREALSAAYAAAGRAAPRWIDPAPIAGDDPDPRRAPDGATRLGAGAYSPLPPTTVSRT